MTDDELLQKLYEGTLSPQEHSALDARMVASPEFAAEAQEFLAVVQLLDNDKQEDHVDAAFLETTREKVAALVAAASAAGIGGAVVQSGSSGLLTAKAVQWLVTILGMAGVGGAVAWNILSDSPSIQPVAAVHDTLVTTEISAVPLPVQDSAVVPHSVPKEKAERAEHSTQPQRASRIAQPEIAFAVEATKPRATVPDNERNTIETVKKTELPEEGVASTEAKDNGSLRIKDTDQMHNYENELAHFKARLSQERVLKNSRAEAKVLLDIASTEVLMKRYDDALLHADESLKLWKKIGETTGILNAHRQVGAVYREMKRLAEASAVLTQGIEVARVEEAEEQKGLLLGELAKVFELQGNLGLAYEKMYAAVMLLRKTSSPHLPVWDRELKRLDIAKKQ